MLLPSQVKSVDRSGQYLIYEGWPTHFKKGLQVEVKAPKASDAKAIIYAGMGGSAAAGGLLQDLLRQDLTVPFFVVKDYHLPAFADKDTFLLAVSCTGDTEEIVNVAHEGLKRGCRIATVSSGGILEEFSLKKGIHHTKIECLFLPRASFPYLFSAAVKVLTISGLLRGVEGQLPESIEVVEKLSSQLRINTPLEKNLAKTMAVQLHNRLPVIYGSPLTRAVAIRFKNMLNENAKMHAIVDVLPELCHNEIVAWEGRGLPLRSVLLRLEREPPKVKKRFEIVKGLIEKGGHEVLEARPQGKGHLSQLISLIYILDFTSLYMAILRGLDPSPTPSISEMKERLKQGTRAGRVNEGPYTT